MPEQTLSAPAVEELAAAFAARSCSPATTNSTRRASSGTASMTGIPR